MAHSLKRLLAAAALAVILAACSEPLATVERTEACRLYRHKLAMIQGGRPVNLVLYLRARIAECQREGL